MKKEDEPDFYSMDKSQPLPTLEEAPLPASSMMPQMRQQGAGAGGLGSPAGLMSTPMGVMSGAGMSAGRDPLMGMPSRAPGMGPMGGMSPMSPMNGMGMNGMGMSPMNGMGMNGMGGMNPMMGGMGAGMGGMNGIPGMNSMNAMNGINSLRDSQFAGQGMGDLGGFGGQAQFERLRHIQQMQLFENRMGGAQMPMGNDTLARMQAENAMNLRLGRQPC